MKKVLYKALSVFLIVAMLLPVGLSLSFAADDIEAPVFTLSKVSETETELVLMFSLKSGSFECFDACITVDGLDCKSIVTTSDFDAAVKAAKVNGAQSVDSENNKNGKFSFSITSGMTGPIDIAEYTFIKETADGINGSDVSFVFEGCYISGEGDSVIDVTAETTADVTLPATHVHVSDNSWVETKAPSCSEKGEKVTHCTECGKVADTQEIPTTEHKNTYVDEKAASCLEDGYKDTYCSDCEQLVSHEVYKATGHDTYKETLNATCTENGYIKTICKTCKKVIGTRVLEATGHGEEIEKNRVEATCTEDGSVDICCKDCEAVLRTEILHKTGHGEEIEKNRVEATCTKDGSVDIYCKDCDTLLRTEILEKKGHGETRQETKKATCTEDGYVKTFCKDCGELISEEVIEATGHGKAKEIRQEATCTEDGFIKTVCSDCGDELAETVIIKAEGHKVETEIVTAKCTEDGYIRHYCEKCKTELDRTVLKAEGHKYVTDQKNPTCHEAGYIKIICSECQDVKSSAVLPQLTHQWTSWQTVKEPTYRSVGISRKTCKLCGDYEEKEIPMTAVPVNEITMSMENITMNFKQSSRLYANVLPEEAAFSTEIVWKSSDTRVCTVDENGTVYAAGRGTAVITASTADGQFSSECTVTVQYTWLQWIIIYILFGWIWYM